MSHISQTVEPIKTSPTAAEVAPEPAAPRGQVISRLLRIPLWILSGFGLIPFLRRSRRARFKVEEVAIYTVHRSFFLWALIVTGFIAATAVRHGGDANRWGWIY